MCRQLICIISFVFVLSMASSIANADLLAQYTFEDGSAKDVIGGFNGTFNGDSKVIDAPGGGPRGKVLSLDGSGDSVLIPKIADSVEFTYAMWFYQNEVKSGLISLITHTSWVSGSVHWGLNGGLPKVGISGSIAPGGDLLGPDVIPAGEWHHIALVKSETLLLHYVDGVEVARRELTLSDSVVLGEANISEWSGDRFLNGMMDDIRVYNHALSDVEIQGAMEGKVWPYATSPTPENGALHADTWVSISWKPGGLATSHDVYFGDNFDAVNDGIADVFQGNQGSTYFVAGFPGFAFPDGLVNGTTYYWRIDEVNEADPNSPWKGDIWSFMVPPKTAYEPIPTDSADSIELNVKLSWTPGFGAKLHYIVFGEDFDQVSNAAAGTPNGPANYSPGSLMLAKTYYWRVDEFDGAATHKGEVWSFTTLGAVSGPNPADGAVDVKPSVVLSWDAGAVAASHEVYFGTDADTVKNASTTSSEYKGSKALGEESYDPGMLTLNTAYYWRIDEVNGTSTDSPWAGNVWSFTTGDFFAIDDFEDYDAGENQIWFAWHDGLGAGAPGTPGYIPGNSTGSAVGDETTASYTEETIVHGGGKSMPVAYDNNKQGYSKYSEVELTLTGQRDWTAEGVTELSLWFRGNPASVGSFAEGPVGTYTMTGSGADIWDIGPGAGEYHDEFHFAYKMLTGPGSIVAKVESVENTNVWAKAAVMIRETLDSSSKHALAAVTPGSGVAFQGRTEPGGASFNTALAEFAPPYWVKLERDVAGNFSAYHSANGTSWQPIQEGAATPIPMTSNVYIGLALTSHDVGLTCEAVFSNVTTTGTVSGQWANQDIGISSNAAEPLYVAVSNTAGTPAVVVHDDPAASTTATWTEWIIPLQALADQGINLSNVDKITIGLGTKGNMTTPGGSGGMFFDDIRLYKPREAAGE